MKEDVTSTVTSRYRCRTTQRWLDDGRVREKREIFLLHRDDADRPTVVTRRERVVTFYTRLRGRERIDNELWFNTNDPAVRERLRAELREFLVVSPVATGGSS